MGATNPTAQAAGLYPGMPLAHARSLIPNLRIEPSDLEADAAALADLAAWCLRFSPFTVADGPDGIWIDASGCAHLFGGERAMLADIAGRLTAVGLTVRIAIADTPGAAWAAARHGAAELSISAVGQPSDLLLTLPIAALRLPAPMRIALGRLGFDLVGQISAAPRGPLALRFGAALILRLDQATGQVFEPLSPILPVGVVAMRLALAEPISTPEAFVSVIAELARGVCSEMERRGLGARQLDLVFERTDSTHQVIRVGAARPARDARHLARLLDERVEGIDPGPGVEAMQLVVTLADALGMTQPATTLLAERDGAPDLAVLVDRLVNRLGASRVYRVAPTESDVPERSLQRIDPMAPPLGKTWPKEWPRPSRLLTPPQLVDALAEMPDRSPAMFVWRRVRHRIRRADGPERIHAEWWKRDAEMWASRDYWRVEDEEGRRFWLYRNGDGMDSATGNLRWFLHGFF